MWRNRISSFSCRAKDCGMTWMTIHNNVAVCGWSVSLSRQMSAILVGRYRWLHFWRPVLTLCYKCLRWLMGKESVKVSFGNRLQSLRPWYVCMCCFCLLHLSTKTLCLLYFSIQHLYVSLAELQVTREEEISRNPLSKVDLSLSLLIGIKLTILKNKTSWNS